MSELCARFEELRLRHWPEMAALISHIVTSKNPGSESSTLAKMCAYHLESGGKRIRAVLPLVTAEALGHDPEPLVAFGAACEVLHNATLVHDDLQDGDSLRRGREAVWRRFGSAQAINLGDAMFYYALLLLREWQGDAARRDQAVDLLLTETLHVIDGQERELTLRGAQVVRLDEYLAMVEGKTSGLFSLPMKGAAILCGADQRTAAAIGEAARHLGVLFQVQDDLVDIFGDKGRGEVGSDIAEGKRSILVVHALNHASSSQARRLLEILDRPREETGVDERATAIQIFEETGAVTRARQELDARREASRAAVAKLDHGPLAALIAKLGVFLDGASRVSLAAPLVTASAGEDLTLCRELLPKVSRTFALSIAALPPGLEEPVLIAYLLCRIVDSIEDDPGLDIAARERLFDIFDAVLTYDERPPEELELAMAAQVLTGVAAEVTLCRRAGAVMRAFRRLPTAQRHVIRPRVLVMLEGMRAYCRRHARDGRLRLKDLTELEEYCYYVAGTVGRLLTDLFLAACPSMTAAKRELVRDSAVSFGVGLQLTNIVKDVAEDLGRDVCFLPESLAHEAGIELPSILEPRHREAGLRVLRAVCARARHHLARAHAYCLSWPAVEGRAVRLFCSVPLVLALETLAVVERGDGALQVGSSPKIDRATVMAVVAEAQEAAGDDARLAAQLEVAR